MTTQSWPSQVAGGPQHCRFCSQQSIDGQIPLWDQPLLESKNFYVVPSLGSLVEGWLLVIPKSHFIATAAIPSLLAKELWTVTSIVREVLTQHFGPVWLFEHGPASEKRAVGCGVDHAHLHLVPLNADLVGAARRFIAGDINFNPATFKDCKTAWLEGLDYLYAEAPGSKSGFMASASEIGSQVFRKAIAELCGCSHSFDWKSDSRAEIIESTIARLESAFEGIQNDLLLETALSS